MKYLGHPEATLTTMWVIARHLASAGKASEGDLVAALRPQGLTSGEGLALKSSLLIGKDLGVFTEGGEAVPQRTFLSESAFVSDSTCLGLGKG